MPTQYCPVKRSVAIIISHIWTGKGQRSCSSTDSIAITMHAQSAQSDTYRVQDAYYYNISIVYVLYYSYHNYNYDYMMIHTGTLINSRVVYISNQRI